MFRGPFRNLAGGMLQSRVSAFGRPPFIRSLQVVDSGSMGGSNTPITITAVDMANTIVVYGGMQAADGSAIVAASIGYATLTNSTTVTFGIGNGTVAQQARATVIEFYSGILRSVQRGVIAITGTTTSGTATIVTVNTTRAAVACLGCAVDTDTTSAPASVTLTNATTVTANRGKGGAVTSSATSVSWEVVEYF